MTTQEINRAMAIMDGFSDTEITAGYGMSQFSTPIPFYTNDYNAIQRVVRDSLGFASMEWEAYGQYLLEILVDEYDIENLSIAEKTAYIASAMGEYHCIAILKALGLFKN